MIPVQADIGGKIIARETIKGFKKDVLTKIHGGGATDRKRKWLEKQKKEKARQQLNTALKPILEKYMSENNISVVVDKKSIVVAKTEIDLTEKILKLLDKDLKSINLN